jgi:F-type H+-transporting ATPase subunit a
VSLWLFTISVFSIPSVLAAQEPAHEAVQPEHAAAAEERAEPFNAGRTIIEHISNPKDHPIIPLPTLFGVDFSVTKHVFMLWFVASIVFVGVIRRYLRQDRRVATGFMNALEAVVEFVRDEIVQPNVGRKWVNTWTPLILTFFIFILCANGIGLIPIFDVLGVVDRWVLRTGEHSIVKSLMHGGTTATANFNVTAALASITFGAIIVAGTKAHGFVKHWKNLVPHGLAWPIYILLIPIEIMGMFVRPFALTMRLAANMTGGHIAILAILSFVFLFTELFRSPSASRRSKSSSCSYRPTCSRCSAPSSSAWPFTLITDIETEDRRMQFLHYFGAALGLGMIVIGAALGIGRFASAAAESIARQPNAADKITGAVNLPLFLLEGVAILAEVFVLLIVLMK